MHFNKSCPSGAQRAELNSEFRSGRSLIMARFLVLLLAALLAPRLAHSQVLYGSLTGNVTDQKGAAVAGAKVDVTNTGTGSTRTTTTDDRGGYSFTDLESGTYKITVTLTSFKTSVKADISVEPNKVYRYDPQLEVGEVRETVVVSSDTVAPLQTDRTDVNTQLN